MDDILKRLGTVSELRLQVTAVLTVIPHLATKADVAAVKADVADIETAIIKWIIATTLTSAALAFAIAKFVH